jgi:hypothetical protein
VYSSGRHPAYIWFTRRWRILDLLTNLAYKLHSVLRRHAIGQTKPEDENMAKKTLKKAKKLEATKPLTMIR